MSKLYKTNVPLYPVDFIYCSDADKLLKHLECDHDWSRSGGFTWFAHEENLIAMWIPHENGSVIIPNLVHECFHAALAIGDKVGLDRDSEAAEHHAYLAGWVSEFVLDCVNKEWKTRQKVEK